MSTSRYPVVLEAVLVLLSFSAGFLAGQRVAVATGNGWFGVLAGAGAFMGSGLTLFRLFPVPRIRKATDQAQRPASLASTLAGYLALFLPGYAGGHFIARWTASTWWGLLSGVFVVVGAAAIFVWLDVRAKRRKAPIRQEAVLPPSEDELVWAEPRAFRSTDLEETKLLVFKLIIFTLASSAFFLWFVNRDGVQTEVTRKLMVTALGIIVMFLGLLGVSRLMRMVVRITGTGVVLDLGEDSVVYAFDTIDSCEIGKTLVGNRLYPVLIVKLKNGDREIFCVDTSVSTERLRAVLERRGARTSMRQDLLKQESLETDDAAL